jgi:hypothetical protein
MYEKHSNIYKNYLKKKSFFNNKGFFMGRTPLALITRDKGSRKGYAYRDMDFYSDNGHSAWRPWITVDQLKRRNNFTYLSGLLVVSFAQKKDYTEVICQDIKSAQRVVYKCRKLILATSALGSARIVLRSLGNNKVKLPLLCNPYSYIPSIQPKMFGRAPEAKKLGFTQLSLFLDQNRDNSQKSVASLYSYQSLMLFRIIRHLPLDFVDARILMQYLQSGLVIMGIHHPDHPSSSKTLHLANDRALPTGDKLVATYSLSDSETQLINKRDKQFIKIMRKTGTYGLRIMNPGYGSSIHYAGTLPFSKRNQPFRLAPDGRLHGTRSIYVADSSGFTYLPAPGLTFSIMANANLVAEGALNG